MRRFAVFLTLVGTSVPAHAQSRVDSVPSSSPDSTIPLAPSPADDIRDQPPVAQPPSEIVDQPQAPIPNLLPVGSAEDTLTRHMLVSVSAGYSNVFGSLDSRTPLRNRLSGGSAFVLDFGYGVTRNVEVELNTSLAVYDSGAECPSCGAHAFDVIGAIRYHLVQGVKFDPWIRTGLGISAFKLSENQRSRTYSGLHWFELSLGGDWYFSRHFGLGPLLAISLSSYFDHPSGNATSVRAEAIAGIGVSFDSGGKL